MVNETTWLKQVKALPLPAVLPVKSLPAQNTSVDDWIDVIREDPMLTIHLFRMANKMLAAHEERVNTLHQVIDLLDAVHLPALTNSIPRVSSTNIGTQGLLNAVGDSLLAASLMKQWFEIRQIQWSETDYWITLFYDLNIWLAWLLKPKAMENIEYEVQQGANKTELLEELWGMPLREWNDTLCDFYQLPVLKENEQYDSRADQRTYAYKQSALKFFLPFSHELASAVRTNWTSDTLQTLCHNGEVSLGLTNFQTLLKQWVTNAAREYRMPQAAMAARGLICQTPSGEQLGNDIGFSQEDLAKAQAISRAKDNNANSSSWPEAEQIQKQRSQRRQHSYLLPLPSSLDSDPEQDLTPRKALDLHAQREIRRQFRNQKTWNSPVEVQESALFGLLNGFAFKRISVLELNNGFLQVIDSEGCKQSPLLRNLKMPIASSDLLIEFTSRTAALWVNANNKSKASRILPPTLLAASEDQPFFLRSFAIRKKVTMLVYADIHGAREPLNAYDYKLFREYCADWNTALNRMKL